VGTDNILDGDRIKCAFTPPLGVHSNRSDKECPKSKLTFELSVMNLKNENWIATEGG